MSIDEIRPYYELGLEQDRLLRRGELSLELVRTLEILERYLPAPPARVLDVGGGAGVYASELARRGYAVHLVEPVELHVEQAREVAAAQPEAPFTAAVGDARSLAEADSSQDAVLLLGPLYHLTERADRLRALQEARRVLTDGGVVVAAAISRYRSFLEGLFERTLDDEHFGPIIERDLRDGQHRNPDPEGHPEHFTTAFFHRPEELREELAAAGFTVEAVLGVEGAGWILADRWSDAQQRGQILRAARAIESVPELLGVSTHIVAVGLT